MVKLVGILNVTPDSFSDGNLYLDISDAIAHAKKLFQEGASLVDVGAESTRPGATVLRWQEEWKRLEPILRALTKAYPEKISVDTYHPETAIKALKLGRVIINDVTGLNNTKMIKVILDNKPSVIISHLKGVDIQKAHNSRLIDDIEEVKSDLLEKVELLEASGIKRDKIIIDPGIGFGKTSELNNKLLRFAEYVPGQRVMIGYSRKRFLGPNRMSIEANISAGKIAAASGAEFIRVHDVAGHRGLLHI